jgi:asparagine synthase (glutamine-hydrolysing)
MPGLFGVIAKNDPSEVALRDVSRRMAASLRSQPWLEEEAWEGRWFCGGRVHLGVLNPDPQPMVAPDGQRVWFDGEAYLASAHPGETPSAERIVTSTTGTASALVQTDGAYALACFDPSRVELTLANDRLGLRPLYVAETSDWFAYASEVKALLAARDTLPALDEVGLRQLIGFEYLFGERTLWKGVKLLPPASVWRISPSSPTRQRYWSFDEIRRDTRPVEEVRERFGTLWRRAIARRQKGSTMPLLLSGGLDSRFVLAELVRQGSRATATTFGEPGSPDMRIAARVARLASIPHRQLHLTPSNWWNGRSEAIWQTDGMVSAIHLAAAAARDALHSGSCYTIKHSSANVLLGDSAIRRGEIDTWPDGLSGHLERRFHENPFFRRDEVVELTLPDCTSSMCGPSPAVFAMSQGQRRWTLTGCLLLLPYCEVVNPSIDLEMLQLMLGGLDDRWRLGSRFYISLLVQEHPVYFADIPWQKTGRGLAESPRVRAVRGSKRRLQRWLGRPVKPRGYIDYGKMLAGSDLLSTIRSGPLLADEYLKGAATRYLGSQPDPRQAANSILGLLTLETYLRQIAGSPGYEVPRVRSGVAGPEEERAGNV